MALIMARGSTRRAVNLNALLENTRDLAKHLLNHVVELRKAFLAGEEEPDDALAPVKALLREGDDTALEDGVEEAAKLLRSLLWSARKVREGETEQLREIASLAAETVKECEHSDSKLTRETEGQITSLEEVLSGKSDVSPRVTMAVAIRHLRRAFREHSEARRRQNLRMGALIRTLQDELKEAQEQGARDGLTGLHNRGAFDVEIRRVLDRGVAGLENIALLMVDIDKFKLINDTHGHVAGDAVLRQLSNLLIRTYLRRDDFVARYGGEEFAIILRDVRPESLHMVAERLRERIAGTEFTLPGEGNKKISVTVSCGVGLITMDDDSPETLIGRVDAGLYQAKQAGRNRVVLV